MGFLRIQKRDYRGTVWGLHRDYFGDYVITLSLVMQALLINAVYLCMLPAVIIWHDAFIPVR